MGGSPGCGAAESSCLSSDREGPESRLAASTTAGRLVAAATPNPCRRRPALDGIHRSVGAALLTECRSYGLGANICRSRDHESGAEWDRVAAQTGVGMGFGLRRAWR
jgi:hypothetical protein